MKRRPFNYTIRTPGAPLLSLAVSLAVAACFNDASSVDTQAGSTTDVPPTTDTSPTTDTPSTTDPGTTDSTTGETGTSDETGTDDGESDTEEPTCTPRNVAICTRTDQGIECGVGNGADAFGSMALVAEDFGDAEGFDAIENWGTIQIADVDGDGLDDLCGRRSSGVWCALGTGDGSFAAATLWADEISNDQWYDTHPSYWATLQFPDVNGDGARDLCVRGAHGLLCGLSNGQEFEAVSVWDDRFTDDIGWLDAHLAWTSLQFADVDGDGSDDVCAKNAWGIVCGVSNGVDEFDSVLWSDEFSNDAGWWFMSRSGTIRFPDVDGDGMADVCGRNDQGIVCAISNGSDGFETASVWLDAFEDIEDVMDDASYWGTIQFPDLDGDGMADVCGRTADGIVCAVSDGSGFQNAGSWTEAYSDTLAWGSDPSYWSTIQFPDLDGDGTADICGRGANGVRCRLSNGVDAFVDAPAWTEEVNDADGYNAESWYRTIRYPVVEGGDCRGTTNATTAVPWVTSAVPPRIEP